MPPRSDRAREAALWAGFGLMCLGMFMAILDIQVVAASLPTIQAGLGAAPQQMSWVQTAYLTAEVVAIPLTGLLTRICGLRVLFVASVSAFTLASAGCAASGGFSSLIAWRLAQGFAGGMLIPVVFSAVFLLIPRRQEALATTIAGVLAVLAPTVGPVVGGWITQTWSWRWLFLINLTPGVVSSLGAWWLLPRLAREAGAWRRLDLPGIAALILFLAPLEIALKRGPEFGWRSTSVLSLLVLSAAAAAGFVARALARADPVVSLRVLRRPDVAVGCALSFALGVGLYGSTYLMPVFLGLVRGHGALLIGQTMLVTGLAQLAAAPVAVALERRTDPRWLSAFGFALFALGLALSAGQTPQTDYAEMVLPQILRGAAIMFCLLPPTRLALGALAPAEVPNASGLFNLMRNLGGAMGLAAIDSLIYGRTPVHARVIIERLQAGDVLTARALGLPIDLFLTHRGPVDDETRQMLEPLVHALALTRAIDEAWLLAAGLTLAALVLLPLAPRRATAADRSAGLDAAPDAGRA